MYEIWWRMFLAFFNDPKRVIYKMMTFYCFCHKQEEYHCVQLECVSKFQGWLGSVWAHLSLLWRDFFGTLLLLANGPLSDFISNLLGIVLFILDRSSKVDPGLVMMPTLSKILLPAPFEVRIAHQNNVMTKNTWEVNTQELSRAGTSTSTLVGTIGHSVMLWL
jgi:hypothetical protein